MIKLRVTSFVFLTTLVWLLVACDGIGNEPPMGGMDGDMMERRMAEIPPEYGGLENPIPANAASLARGQELYEANCAVCHGEEGQGNGPAAAGLDPQPAPIAHTSQMLSDAYLFYRISEGGAVAPFNSAMPAFKESLDESERWHVINYVRSLDGGMMGGGMMGGNMLMMVAMFLFFIGVLVAIVLAVLWVIRQVRGRDRAAESPLEMLKRRYARGEIDAEQYEVMKRELEER